MTVTLRWHYSNFRGHIFPYDYFITIQTFSIKCKADYFQVSQVMIRFQLRSLPFSLFLVEACVFHSLCHEPLRHVGVTGACHLLFCYIFREGWSNDFLEVIFKFSNINEVLSGIHYSCEDGIEKSVPRDHQMSSLCKPSDANR